MKLIIIHGPPAAGKYTVANEIAARTGFKVFHNHLSIDCVQPVFDFGTKPFFRLVERIRMDTIAEAAREGVDLIHTFVYAHEIDDEHFGKIIASAEDNGGEVHVVSLQCEKNETKRRVTSEHRLRMRKVSTPEMVESLHEKFDLYSPLPGRETLVIDNTGVSAAETAERIIKAFDLARQPPIADSS